MVAYDSAVVLATLDSCERELTQALAVVRAARVVAAHPDPTQQLAETVQVLARSASAMAGTIVNKVPRSR